MKVLVRVYVREGGKVRGNVCGQGGGRGLGYQATYIIYNTDHSNILVKFITT